MLGREEDELLGRRMKASSVTLRWDRKMATGKNLAQSSKKRGKREITIKKLWEEHREKG